METVLIVYESNGIIVERGGRSSVDYKEYENTSCHDGSLNNCAASKENNLNYAKVE